MSKAHEEHEAAKAGHSATQSQGTNQHFDPARAAVANEVYNRASQAHLRGNTGGSTEAQNQVTTTAHDLGMKAMQEATASYDDQHPRDDHGRFTSK